MAKMVFKKATKHTVVYETDDYEAPVTQVYVGKHWLSANRDESGNWPAAIDLDVKVIA